MFRNIIVSILIMLFTVEISANSIQEADSFYFDDVEIGSTTTSLLINQASLENMSLHEVIIELNVYNNEALEDLVIISDFLEDQIYINKSQFDLNTLYHIDTDLNDSNNGYYITVEWINDVHSDISISFKKKPITDNTGVILPEGVIDIVANTSSFSGFIRSTIYGYLEDGTNLIDTDSDALLRLTIPPIIKVQPESNPITIQQGNSQYFKSFIEKTNKSILNYHWDFVGESKTSDVQEPGFIFFDNYGRSQLIYTVTDDLGISSSYETEIVVIPKIPPSTPTLLYPYNDEIISDSIVQFYWTPSEDFENNEITYDVIISTDSSFSDPVKVSYVLPTMLLTTIPFFLFPLKKASRKKRYLIFLFITVMSVILISCSIPIEQNQTTLVNNLNISDDLVQEQPEDDFVPPANSLTLTYSELQKNQDYYWKVIATDSFGVTTESSVGYFRTE